MDEVLDASTVTFPEKVDVFVIMYRSGGTYWFPVGAFNSAKSALSNVQSTGDITAYRVVKVSGLPTEMKAGAV